MKYIHTQVRITKPTYNGSKEKTKNNLSITMKKYRTNKNLSQNYSNTHKPQEAEIDELTWLSQDYPEERAYYKQQPKLKRNN